MWLPDQEEFDRELTPAEQRRAIRIIVIYCAIVLVVLAIVFHTPGIAQ